MIMLLDISVPVPVLTAVVMCNRIAWKVVLCYAGSGDGGSDMDCSKSCILHYNLRLAVLRRRSDSRGRQMLRAVPGRRAV